MKQRIYISKALALVVHERYYGYKALVETILQLLAKSKYGLAIKRPKTHIYIL